MKILSGRLITSILLNSPLTQLLKTIIRNFIIFTSIIIISIFCFSKTLQFGDLSPELTKEALQKFPSLSTQNPTLSDLDELLRFLMSQGIYENLQIVENENYFKLEFRNLKSIKQINYSGLSSFDSRELNQWIQVETGQKFDPRILNEIQDKIVNYYSDQGYLNTKVNATYLDSPDNTVDLNIKIQEETPLKVNSIFLDSKNNELVIHLNKNLKKYLGKIYNPQLATSIPKQIQDYLRFNNYIRATIQGPEIHMNASKTSVDLTYHLERTEQYSIVFEGNYSYPNPRLLSAIEFNSLTLASPNILAELTNKLKEFYWRKGYSRVEIKGEEKVTISDVKSSLLFQISEGNPIKIDSIDIQGNYTQPAKYYQSFLKKHSGETIADGYFHRNDFESGLKNLVIELQNSGFLKAKLISSRYQFNKNKDKITITVNIDEGPMTKINAISYHGLKNLTENELNKNLNVAQGEALKLGILEEGLQQIKAYAQDRGYLEFRILNEKENLVKYNDDNTLATIDLQIEEGPQVKVGSILLDGNSLTKDYVLHKEIDFKVGDVLTPNKIEESTRRLQKLGLFNSVEIKTLEQRTQVTDRTIIVKVVERPPGLFNFGAGVTNERTLTLRGFTGIAYRNIQGTARGLSTRAELNYNVADIKYPELKITAGYLEPYLFDSRTKGRINFTRATQVVSYDDRTASDTYQVDFLLEQNLTSHILLSYDLWNISHVRDFFIDSNEKKLEIDLASTGPAIELDYRDHPFNPTQGTFTRMQVEYSHPLLGNTGAIEFLKSSASFTHYLPFRPPNPIVWANSLRVGDLQNINKNDGVPYDKKGFILGGLSTIRGFEAGTRERFPNNADLLIPNDAIYLLKSRSQFFLIKSEIRFPIWGAWGGAIFYDGGLVKVDNIKFKDPYRDSIGIGIRYNTPVGPLNIEFAKKLDVNKERDESEYLMHISIGTF